MSRAAPSVDGAAHAFGPGELMDLLVLGAAMLFLGHEAFDFGQHMALFVSKTLHATDERDIDDAAHHLASAIAIVGIDILLVMLTRGGTKAWNNRYRPTIKADSAMPAGEGLTFKYGDIEYSSGPTSACSATAGRNSSAVSKKPSPRATRNSACTVSRGFRPA